MKKKLFRTSIFIILFLLLTAFLFNSYPNVTKEDKQYINLFLKEWNINSSPADVHRDFESEYAFISRVQDSIVGKICHSYVSTEHIGAVKKYYKERQGYCYDRAVMLEKFFIYYGFTIRHVFVYFNPDNTLPDRSDFFSRELLSHAMLEVKTKKGWMAVGTSCNWLGVQEGGELLDTYDLRRKLADNMLHLSKKGDRGVPFYATLKNRERFKIIYGVYSRHGDFFRSKPLESGLNAVGVHCRIPDYNLRMLLYNF